MDREKQLKSKISRLTKQIGQAKKQHDFNEIENLRKRRGTFTRQLIEEFGLGFCIKNGKTVFLPLAELEEHYSDPDVKARVGIANVTNDLLQSRDMLQARKMEFLSKTAEEVRDLLVKELDNEVVNIERIITDINANIGNDPVDFKKIDEKRKTGDDFLDGIDLDSLK